MGATQLGYMCLEVSDLPAWRSLMTRIVGAQEVESPEPEVALMRFDEHQYRLALRQAGADRVTAIGWQVSSLSALDDVARRLDKMGIAYEEGSKALLMQRRVVRLLRFRDPDEFPLEVYSGPSIAGEAFRPSRSMSGFNCGELGLGHVVLVSKDTSRSSDFYQGLLGFKLSDYITWDEADGTFLHCNGRHHSLALLNECYGMKGGDVHHIMIETRSLDDVGTAYDLVHAEKIPLIMTLGRHSNDHMTSFYLKTPSGFGVEYGYGGRLVDDEHWQIRRYSTPKLWGHDLVL